MKKFFVLSMLVLASVSIFAKNFSKEEQELISLSNQKWAWMSEKNADKLAELFLPESQFVHMGGSWSTCSVWELGCSQVSWIGGICSVFFAPQRVQV